MFTWGGREGGRKGGREGGAEGNRMCCVVCVCVCVCVCGGGGGGSRQLPPRGEPGNTLYSVAKADTHYYESCGVV